MVTEAQVGQLRSVIDVRERRLERELAEALCAHQQAEQARDDAANIRDQRNTELTEAKLDFARTPSNEPAKIWRDVCEVKACDARTALHAACEAVDVATHNLTSAQRAVRQMKERGRKITDIGADLKRAAVRDSETRAEDDTVHMPVSLSTVTG